jgi:hypothetical protein
MVSLIASVDSRDDPSISAAASRNKRPVRSAKASPSRPPTQASNARFRIAITDPSGFEPRPGSMSAKQFADIDGGRSKYRMKARFIPATIALVAVVAIIAVVSRRSA